MKTELKEFKFSFIIIRPSQDTNMYYITKFDSTYLLETD